MHSNKEFIKNIEETFKHRTPKPEGIFTYSAVIALILEINDEPHILLNKRALTLKNQPGDICLPGGRMDYGETPLETVLRETYEELRIEKKDINILGRSDYIVTPYGSIIIPFVGYIKDIELKDINYSKDEVDKIFTVPLKFFTETVPLVHSITLNPVIPDDFPLDKIYNGNKYKWSVGKVLELFYEYKGEVIWGFTARVINNICTIINEVKD